METRGLVFVASCLTLLGLLSYNAIANDLTTWGIVATVATGALGVGTLYVVIAKDNLTVLARALAAGLSTSLVALAAFGVFGDVNETISPNNTSTQRMADQANAELYSTDSVTILPDEAGHIKFTKDSCLPFSELPPGVSLWNGELQENGMITNNKGYCTLTIDRTGNYVRLLPTLNGQNAANRIKHLPSDPSELVVQFPVDVRMDVYVYNPERARQQGAKLMPYWVSNNGLCNGCSSAAAHTSSN